MSLEKLGIEERRARLERRANTIRSRLLRTIDELDVRRHQVTAIAQHGKRLAIPATVAVVGGVLLAAGLLLGAKKLFTKKPTFGDEARRIIGGFRVQKQPSVFDEAVRKLVVTTVAILGAAAAKRGAQHLFEGRSPALLPPAK